ncbi:phosphatidylinositol kinase [Rhodoferax koreense]|uniref:Phosphatidylinositol kinase n=1 Tax=Rhodoferax koreensis TaxID=1842727 RepID=A0A1P8JX38_9BURK|nr:type II toxin-antitoxin system HipA family toxin [Rhodoferax koreense]APW38313.1 phosphatidylinositol kinase [Rhodoferax koreense]
MNVQALDIFLGARHLGVLFRYAMPGAPVITRFVADPDVTRQSQPTPQPLLGAAFLAPTPDSQRQLWLDIQSPRFNGRYSAQGGWLLPPWFQNLLPEGVFRDHVAARRGCDPNDHFEMLAACGLDLPGNVSARPAHLDREGLAHLVTQDNDALEMSVTAEPMEEGVSVSGIQPKLAVLRQGDRYVGRTKAHDTHIIAKLPVVGRPRLPELEHLSLQLAGAAGVNVCETSLVPLRQLVAEHGYELEDSDGTTNFLAVVRFDRTPTGRIHCEDFAQVLSVMPEEKYSGSYLAVAAAMMALPSLGEPAVHELLRRLAVNEMLGNPDMHLKNIGLIYPDGVTPAVSPAYDIVGYSAFSKISGHALRILPAEFDAELQSAAARRSAPAPAADGKPRLGPYVLRIFCDKLGIPEKPATAAVRHCVAAAARDWPALIAQSLLSEAQKARLLAHFKAHPWLSQKAAHSLRAAPTIA